MAAAARARPGCLPPDLSRHLRDRAPQPGAPDPLRNPERAARRGAPSAPTRRGSTWSRRCGRPASRCSASTPTAPAGRLRRARVQPVGRARLHEPAEPASTSRASRCATRTARPSDPIVIAGGHCAYNPEPLAEYVDAFVIGDGEEVIGEIADVVGAWKRGGRASREAVLRELATIPGVYVPSMYDVDYDGPHIRAVTPRYRRRPGRGRQAHGRRPRRVAVPEAAARAARRGRARPAERRDLPRLHARLPLLPGRDDHPARCGSGPRSRCARWSARACARTGYDEVALTSLSSADFSGIDGVVADLVNDQEGTGAVSVSLPSLRVDAFSVGIASEIQKVRRTGLTFAPEAGSWRLRQVINKLILEDDLYTRGRRRVLAGLAAGEALLPHRSADRDGRRHARHRRSSRRTSCDIGRKYTKQASCTVSVGGFVPKPHTPFQWFGQNGVDELRAQDHAAPRTATKGTGAQVKWHDPRGDVRRRASVSRGDRRDRSGHRSGSGAPAARSRSGASISRSTAGSTPCTPRASTPTGT